MVGKSSQNSLLVTVRTVNEIKRVPFRGFSRVRTSDAQNTLFMSIVVQDRCAGRFP